MQIAYIIQKWASNLHLTVGWICGIHKMENPIKLSSYLLGNLEFKLQVYVICAQPIRCVVMW